MKRSTGRGRRVVGLLGRPRVRLALAAAALALLAGLAWLIWPFWQLSGQFAEHPTRQPSRLFARPTALVAGEPLDLERLLAELAELSYREVGSGARVPPGAYHRADGQLTVHLRRFPTPKGTVGGTILRVAHNGTRVRSLELDGRDTPSAWVEPVLLATYYGDELQERRPVRYDEVPEELVWAVLAAEDASFFEHGGISPSGILRAAWVNLRGGTVRQGGSTLTQQLVKNLYLTHERTYSRKAREAVLAVLLEARYPKVEILEAYLNEIYMGASNGVSLIGMGAAARAYFGKDVAELDLGEAATLAGMIQSPANYGPVDDAEAARERRDWVLARMVEAGVIEGERAEGAAARPVVAHPRPLVRRRAPYFAEFAAGEAAERFAVQQLEGTGYQLLSTLDWRDQEAARDAVTWGVEALEAGWEKGHQGDAPLQSALVSIDPVGGGILAYVGGRSYEGSQFDRAGMALRQAGSAFKPVVYAAAFADGRAYPATFLEDAPLTVRQGNQRWSPRNSDGVYHGWVTARTAMEDSLNAASARLALQTGLDRVVAMARRMGIDTPLEPYPAISLGAFEVTAIDMAQVYAVLAADGVRPPVHALEAVLDVAGRAVDGQPLAERERVLSAETAFLLTSLLQGVVDHGTAASARGQGVRGPLAGKTGTTNGRRDSWFAGYSPDRTTVVWVGYDDNAATSLSGSRAAVPIWGRFVMAVRPPGGYRNFAQPPGITTAVVDPTTGLLATDACPYAVTEVFPRGGVPRRVCDVHRGWDFFDVFTERDRGRGRGRGRPSGGWDGREDGREDGRAGGSGGEPPPGTPAEERAERAERAERERERGVRGWFRRVFGGEEEEREEDEEEAGGEGEEGGDPTGEAPR